MGVWALVDKAANAETIQTPRRTKDFMPISKK
jgi:hypothetical protein